MPVTNTKVGLCNEALLMLGSETINSFDDGSDKANVCGNLYDGVIANLQALINRLTYGDLANASPTTALAGSKASYSAGLAQALTLDPGAVSSFSGLAEAYAQAGRASFASGPQYEALKAQIIRDLSTVTGLASGGAASTGTPANLNEASATLVAINTQQAKMIGDLGEQVQTLQGNVSALITELRAARANRA